MTTSFFSGRDRKLIIALFIIGGLARLAFLVLPLDFLVTYKVPDDALYYFAMAKHLALGHGISFDGVHPANGLHPLWLFVITPFYLIGLKGWTAVNAILVFESLLDLVVAWRLLKLLDCLTLGVRENARRFACLGALVFYLLHPIVIVRGISGLETTLVSLLLVVWLEQFVRIAREDTERPRAIMFGILSGLFFLARTDMIVIMALSCALILPKIRRVYSIKEIAVALGSAGAIALPWLLWNQIQFGTILQSSAEAVPFVAQRKFNVEYGATGKYLHLFGEAARNALKLFFYGAAVAILLAWLYRIIDRKREVPITGNLLNPVVFSAVVLIVIHTVLRGFIRDWYVIQLIPLIIAYSFIEFCRSGGNLHFISNRIQSITFSLVALWFAETGTPRYESQRSMVFAGVPFVEHLKAGERLGSFNSGYYGYFAPEASYVQNLDGVDNPAALDFIKQGRLHDYLTKDSIETFMDFRGDIEGFSGLIDKELMKDYRLDSAIAPMGSRDSLMIFRRLAKR